MSKTAVTAQESVNRDGLSGTGGGGWYVGVSWPDTINTELHFPEVIVHHWQISSVEYVKSRYSYLFQIHFIKGVSTAVCTQKEFD